MSRVSSHSRPQQEPDIRPTSRSRSATTSRSTHEPRLRELGRSLGADRGARHCSSKFKAVVLALFKLKIFATSVTMLVSIAAYAWIWGWRFAVGFVLLLLVHELGHVSSCAARASRPRRRSSSRSSARSSG